MKFALPLVALGLVAAVSCNNPPPDPDSAGPQGGSSSAGTSGTTDPGRAGGGGSSAAGPGGSSGSGAGGDSGGAGGTDPAGGAGNGQGGSGGNADPGSGGAPGSGGQGGAQSQPDAGPGNDAPAMPPPNNLEGVKGHPNPMVDYPKYEGFSLALVEEFDQPLDLDNDPIWTWSDGGLSEGAVRFVKDGITFRDGKMVLTARQQRVPRSPSYAEPDPNADVGEVLTKDLSSGELRSKFNNYRYGRYEARMKAPTTNGGNFIATLFVFRTPKFYQWREIDIEVIGRDPGGLITNLIYGDDRLGWSPDIEDRGDVVPGSPALPAGFNNQTDFHTYAFEWLPNKITWFVDGKEVRVKNQGGGRPIPQHSAKIMMNLWIFNGAAFGGDPTRNNYPMASEYEWFRFYKWDQDNQYPCADPPGCLPAEDKRKSKNNPNDGLAP